MASNWARMKLHYLGSVRVSRLLAPVVLLACIFLIFRWLRGPGLGLVMYGRHGDDNHKMQNAEIHEYLSAMEDTRPQQCYSEFYHLVRERQPRVSILLDFHEDQLYNLKLTLTSIVENTPDHLYQEIIVLDDGTGSASIRKHAADFIMASHFKKVKAYRSKDRSGQAATRYKAARVAEGDLLVFVSSTVVVNRGWLEPLLEAVLEYHSRLVVPHSDNFVSEKRFFKTDNNLVSVFTWPLSTVYMESADDNPTLIKTPVMRGDVIAVKRSFLEKIGNFDEGFKDGEGHNLELSLRAWLCGGEIKVSLCSRVATHNALKPVEVSNPINFRRITKLWLRDYEEVMYKQGEVKPELSDAEKEAILIRQSYLRQHLSGCKNFAWFLSNVAPEVVAPSHDMAGYGKLHAMTSYCVRSLADDSPEVDMVPCRPYMFDPDMMFELDTHGYIRRGDRCLRMTSRGHVDLAPCHDNNDKERWDRRPNGHLVSRASGKCLAHETTAEDAFGHYRKHDVILSDCQNEAVDERRQSWSFINY